MDIFERAKVKGWYFECSCVDCGLRKWEQLMEGAVRADKRKVHRIAKLCSIVPDGFHAGNNNYNQLKTKTHIIYVHSGIEHFIKVNP